MSANNAHLASGMEREKEREREREREREKMGSQTCFSTTLTLKQVFTQRRIVTIT